MSNFSRNENFHEQTSHSKNESKSKGSDKTIAFLAALEEARNVLNILLQAVNKDKTESYAESSLLINSSLEFNEEEEPKEPQETSQLTQNLNEETNNLDDGCENGDVSTFLASTFKRTISQESSNIANLNIVPSQFVNEYSPMLNNISINNEGSRHLPLKDGHSVNASEKPSGICNVEQEILQDAERDAHSSKISTNDIKGTLPNPSPLTQNYKEKFGIVTATNSVKHKAEEILQIPQEYNSKYYEGSSQEQRQPFHTSDDKGYPEARNIPKKERGILNMRELTRLLQFPTEVCENELNTILNQIERNSGSEPEIEYDSGPNQNPLKPTFSSLQRETSLKALSENERTAPIYLPTESIPNTPGRCEREMIGDDCANTRTHITCECDQPSVAGGAVPVVMSFTMAQDNYPQDNEEIDDNENKDSPGSSFDTHQTINIPQKTKPTQIPKLSCSKNANRINSLGRTEKQRHLGFLANHEENQSHVPLNISSRMLELQERLKATTSLIRQKISNGGEKAENENDKHKAGQSEKLQLRFDEESFERQRRQKKLRQEFSKHLTKVAQGVSKLKEIDDLSVQTASVNNLYTYITELKRLSSELNDIERADYEKLCTTETSQELNDRQSSSFESHKLKTKDNKIYIKFLPTKFGLKKKKSCNAEVQTQSSKESLSKVKSDPMKANGESGPKSVDSMDGLFIPSSEEPLNMDEEDDEDDCLDITITFPEFQQHITHEGSSHLSVSFSDISAEALGRLRRCPKEFTLHMDFVNGRMFFQSGKSPANNFSIGPDLKIVECAVNNKMSDIISIKPSTECMYNSQLIPVEGTKRKSSIKTLKSTDSELFNVVSLPKINRKASGNTKSCITFKNERCISAVRLLSERRSYRSMPQIPSLTKILEEPAIESANTSRAAMMNSEKKPRNKTLPKKKANISLEKLTEA